MIKYYREGTNVNLFCSISFISLYGYAALLLNLCGVRLRDALGASALGKQASLL
jgi:hypothetical protein